MNDGELRSEDDPEEPTIAPTPKVVDPDATVAPGDSNPRIADSRGESTSLKNFELLDELGRGGMGVVHKARDKKLDRIVAVKTIIAGGFASAEDIGRFRQEAQAAAKLDHPGIVEIYEVSDAGNEHQFFSMKYVSGGSLADLKDQFTLDPRRGVELMAKVVDAIHHAHQRGILHRDLKPANILIDDNDQPRITDFGLAKHLHSDSSLTKTGTVMGTPGFMAPEQASGKSDVTTAADIYSLGAILYWILVGRTPHQGETQLETIMKTLHQDPDSIRSHKRDADHGLDLICQKALKIDPDDRYHSAEELTGDLQAWLAGEPLSVRPPSVLELTSLWIRKNFRSLAIGTTTGAICGGMIGLNILIIMCHQELATENYYLQLGDAQQSWVSRYFHWTKDLPSGLVQMLGPMVVWITVLFGYLTIRFLKPQRREVVFAAAAIAALIAGIVSFTTSLGWSPIIRQGLEQGAHDVDLISDALWLETDEERAMAKNALFQRYPGLKEVEVTQRGQLIKNKIIRDQSNGIPLGMWEGIGITLCLSVIPLFVTTVFSGLIWQRGNRGWSHLGQTVELGIYSALAFLFAIKFFSRQINISPGLFIQCLTLAALGLAVVIAFRNARWYWRIFGFVLSMIVVFGNTVESIRIANAGALAGYSLSEADFRTSANYLERSLSQVEEPYTRYQLAILYAYLDEDAGYVEQCDTLLSNFENMHRPEVAERVAKTFLLKPEMHSDLTNAHELAEAASVLSHSSYLGHWFMFCRALSELRQGNHAETWKWNADCRERITSYRSQASFFLKGATHLVDALAYHASDDDEQANESLQLAMELRPEQADYENNWENRLYFEVLLREAQSKVGSGFGKKE